MKFKNISEFKKKVNKDPSCLTLIVSKSEMGGLWKAPFVVFSDENFSLDHFLNEVETSFLFSSQRYVAIKNVDRLKTASISSLLRYAKHPNPSVYLLLIAEKTSSISSLVKEIEKRGDILDLSDEKPWEKENQLVTFLVEEAHKNQVTLTPEIAKKMVLRIGQEETLLSSELEKLICFVGEKKKITNEDLEMISQKLFHGNLWQWSEAIFKRNFAASYSIGFHLLENDVSFFALLSNLRNQVRKAIEMCFLLENEGPDALTKNYPYLKGGLLQKKLDEIKSYGRSRFKKAFIALISCELEAKNSSVDHELLLERLLVKLCR